MNFLPVLQRELRVAAKRPITYYGRFIGGLTALTICLSIIFFAYGGVFSPSGAGHGLFVSLASVGLGYALLAGVLSTADCISAEKREGTLGLMFLTDLRGLDVVIGKLAACGLRPLYILLAGFPAPALGFFLGGLTVADYLHTMVSLVNALFFALSLGLLVSTLTRQERMAIGGAMFATLIVSGVLPALASGVALWHGKAPVLGLWAAFSQACLLASPASAPLAALEQATGRTLLVSVGGDFWMFFWTTHFLAWILLILAGCILPRVWQEKADSARRLSLTQLVEWLKTGAPERPAVVLSRRERRSIDPGLWLAERRAVADLFFWSWAGIAGAIYVTLAFYSLGSRQRDLLGPCGVIATVLLHWILKLEVAIQASRAFAEERRSGALELLLTTPLGVEDIIRGKLLWLKRQFLGPVLLLLGIDLFVCTLFWSAASTPPRQVEMVLVSGLALLIFTGAQLVDMYALSWVGLWLGLVRETPARALRDTLASVLVRPFTYLLIIGALLAPIMRSPSAPQFLVGSMVFLFPVAVILGVTQACGGAMSRLQDDFRVAAAQIVEPAQPARFWRRCSKLAVWLRNCLPRSSAQSPRSPT